MSVLLAPSAYLPVKSGVAVSTHHLANALSRKGYHVVIVTPRWELSYRSFEMIDGIEVHRMPFRFPWPLVWQRRQEGFLSFFRHCPIDLQRLVRLMDKKQVKVINIQSADGLQVPYLLSSHFFGNRRLVVTLQGMEFFQLNTRHNRMRRILLRYALRRADQIIAVSSHLASEAARFCPEASDKIVRIPNGVAVDEFDGAESFPFPSPYLLSLARLNLVKGHDVLLAAFQKVAKRENKVHLIIAGDGPQRVRLHAVAMALGIQDRVTFLGEVGRERVEGLLAGCKFLVFPSWNEGIPLAALEAMASRKAIISTHVGGIPEIVSHSETGLLVPPGDPNSLADAMLTLLQYPDQCKAMGERGRAFVEANHGFTQIVDQYLEVYRKALLQSSEGLTR
jgi:glycosyltransferase involved in cell wall biosynthesis